MTSRVDDIAENVLCFVHVGSCELFQLNGILEDGLLNRLLLLDLVGELLLKMNGRNQRADGLLRMIEKEIETRHELRLIGFLSQCVANALNERIEFRVG